MRKVRLHHYTKGDLDSYMTNDYISNWLAVSTTQNEQKLGCNKWLTDSPMKRLVFHDIYADLLDKKNMRNILDIGGGVTAYTKILGDFHEYTLIDMLSHDDQSIAEEIFQEHNITFLKDDWYNVSFKNSFDCVICNDLFPNVDQRIKLFLEKLLPISRSIRVLLTYHNNDRFYKVKRTDADEVMFLQAWSGKQLGQVLESIFPELERSILEGLSSDRPSLYANGRLISLLRVDQSL